MLLPLLLAAAAAWDSPIKRRFRNRTLTCDAATRSDAVVEWRSNETKMRCAAARCASLEGSEHEAGELYDRWAIFMDEVVVISPHKGGSKYCRESFARAYGCDGVDASREVTSCGGAEQPLTRERAQNLLKVLVVRDPVDRVIAMYNHLVASPSRMARAGLEHVCNGSLSLKERHEFAMESPSSNNASMRALRFQKFLACIVRVKDVAHLAKGLYFRHFQPAARYAFAAEADVVGRVEDLGALLEALVPRLSKLRASLLNASRWPDAWLGDREKVDAEIGRIHDLGLSRRGAKLGKHAGKTKRPTTEFVDATPYTRGNDLHPWSVHRCEVAAEVRPAASRRPSSRERRPLPPICRSNAPSWTSTRRTSTASPPSSRRIRLPRRGGADCGGAPSGRARAAGSRDAS